MVICAQGTRDEVGSGPGRRVRLCAPRREALADAERGLDHDGSDLDAVVPDYQAQELSVRVSPSFRNMRRERD